MKIKEVIYCMESYLPESSEHCEKCRYYGINIGKEGERYCMSSAAHRMAIRALEQEPCEDAGEVSDGYHTFNQLYHQRAILFATIVNQNKDKAWKSFKHSDGKYCFDSNGEWFVVGVDTPEGSYTYHYSKEYWDYFECKELDCGKEWDGHTEEDVTRLLSLKQEPCEDAISLEAVIEWLKSKDIIKLSSQADTARKELKTLSSGKLQPSGDAISRQRVLDINFKRIPQNQQK